MGKYPVELVEKSVDYLAALERQSVLPPVHSVENIKPTLIQRNFNTSSKSDVFVTAEDTISAVISVHNTNKDSKIGVLNFASFKNPGGGYMTGARAQEEALCHCTNLYADISKHTAWYERHKSTLNKGLYQNECMLSQGITVFATDICKFLLPAQRFQVDILTCAAPNWRSIMQYSPNDMPKAREATKGRINYVCNVFAQYPYNYLILGAYGCGVFKNEPKLVAETFRDALSKTARAKNIIFAIPDKTSENYKTFLAVFGKHSQV